MKISNDILKMYGLKMEQKGEAKLEVDKVSADGKNAESQLEIEDAVSFKSNSLVLPKEVREVLESVFGKNIPLDKETIQILKTFFDKFPGTLDEKINILQNLMAKELDINIKNLRLMYEALYGKEISSLLTELGAYPVNDLDTLISDVKNMMSHGVSFDKILDFIEQYTENHQLNPKAKEILIRLVGEGRQAVAFKMEDLAEKIVIKGLKDIEKEEVWQKTEDRPLEKAAEHLLTSQNIIQKGAEQDYAASLLAAAGLETKNYLITEITVRLKEAANNFKTLKRDIVNNLDMAVRYIKEQSSASVYNAKTTLEKTIEMLDKAILKSDIALFADMKTEKELVKADSQLQKAKVLLDKGQYDEAWNIVEKVKNNIESMNWKPSNKRLVHFATFKNGLDQNTSQEGKLRVAMENLINTFKEEDYSPRKVYEAIRLMGQDHEGETARFLAGEKIDEDNLKNNIKSLLLSQPDRDKTAGEFIEKISGNQLMNKEGNGPLQTMFFALPFALNGRLNDMKIYINSKKNENKLDWQNCSIFFLVDTRKLGETGILLQASGGNLNITIKNDREDLKDKAQPLIYGLKDNLEELGYKVGHINFDRLNAIEEDKKSNLTSLDPLKSNSFNYMKKGIDIRI